MKNMQDYIPIQKDINEKLPTVTVKQFDNLSRFIHVQIFDNDLPNLPDDEKYFNLENCTARLYIQPKGDDSGEDVAYIDGEVADGEIGIVTFLLPSSVTETAGNYEGEIWIYGAESSHPIISTKSFDFVVEKSIRNNTAIEGTSKFTALDNALSSNDLMRAQIAALIASPAGSGGDVGTELRDIRTGYDGTEYETAGDAVRGQVQNALIPFQDNFGFEYTLNDGYINGIGGVSQATAKGEVYTSLFEPPKNQIIKFYLHTSSSQRHWVAYAMYDANENFLSRVNLVDGTQAAADSVGVEFEITNVNCKYISIMYRSYGSKAIVYLVLDKNNANEARSIALEARSIALDAKSISEKSLSPAMNTFKPLYDHLFVGRTGGNSTIPHESLYHVGLSRSMGFNVIEANIKKTSDNVFWVNHTVNNTFSGYFHHVDGTTDISNVNVSSVTWDWIVQNVRYNSQIEKYRTRPPRLEEFLSECKKQNMIPFLGSTDSEAVAITDGYMGKNNYIIYGGSRSDFPNAILYHWVTLTTKDDILAYCQSVGQPFIYGMANKTAFTDSELRDIVETLHKNGYWVGTSYADNLWYKYSGLGFDFNGTLARINRITNGNICNLSTIYGFDDFTVTGATESGGVLTFSGAGTVVPNIENTIRNICGIDVELECNGSFIIPDKGEHVRTTYTTNGKETVFVCFPVIRGTPKVTIEVSEGTIIYDIKYKASAF